MLGTLLGAAVLGVIITVMEDGDFPGWFPMVMCVLAASIPAFLLNSALPPHLFIVGSFVGALCATVAISFFCQMTVWRAFIASQIYFAFQLVLGLLLYFMLK
ncbi:hypothetical protein Pan44_36880 [Caulifigura coniformis]|uniref:Permease n=1 Tax=Caulifigura coniformis TaxID=2527983 RepID=A0A517SHN8_9PLAN|nr:hypothetical protein [Caulifigura coniformis]QDT55642.1 hypothetical protein Pan44_36880 [Caulifigura coniformis]